MSPAAFSMLSGMLGPQWAVAVLVCAILLGLFAGYMTQLLRPYGFTEEELFRAQLPQGDFHDPNYPVEELRCRITSYNVCYTKLLRASAPAAPEAAFRTPVAPGRRDRACCRPTAD